MSKVVIVTGAAGGLGSAIAAKFAARGDKVVLNDLDGGRAEALAERIKAALGTAIPMKADVTSLREVDAMVGAIVDRWGRIDVLVNCAGAAPLGVAPTNRLIVDFSEEEWDGYVDLNLKGPFICIKAVAPHMMKQRLGHIVNIGSGVGLQGDEFRVAYASAKAGVVGLTKVAARELADYNIQVNTICPGFILHERRKEKLGPELSAAILDRYTAKDALLHRIGTAEEFAAFVVHVTDMENISGQLLNTDSRIVF